MAEEIVFTIDGKECTATKGMTITEAARKNNVFIPTLCDFEGLAPTASCRICIVNVNGHYTTGCTEKVAPNMRVLSESEDIQNIRKSIIEMMFVDGNHYCPSCEKSGNCELQAFAYKYEMTAPRYDYTFKERQNFTDSPYLMLENNRCIFCRRCVRGIKSEEGENYFSSAQRGDKAHRSANGDLIRTMSETTAEEAMAICPVGSILKKEKGFSTPIGERLYDNEPISLENQHKGGTK